jgi:hypothetical protein
MKSANHRWGLPTFIVAIALFSGLFALTMIRVGASNDLTAKNPSVELRLAKTSIIFSCPPSARSISGSCPPSADVQIPVVAMATGFTKDASYSYSVGGGRIAGEGSKVLWDLSGVGPGSFVIKVEVRDSKKRLATSAVTLTISMCGDCVFDEPCMFTMVVDCYERVQAGTPITCKLTTSLSLNPDTHRRYTYQWIARDSDDHDLTATITKQGEYISIPTKGLGGKHVITRVEVKEVDPSCNRTASGITFVKP